LPALECELETVVSGKADRLFAVPMGRAIKEIQDATNRFNQFFKEMDDVIAIFNPELSDILWIMLKGKERILQSNHFPIEIKLIWGDPDCVFRVEVYESTATDRSDFRKSFSQLWSSLHSPGFSVLGAEAPGINRITRREIASNDKQQLELLLRELREHAASLTASREMLAEFIRSQFSLEDLLR
jgi:hypothetical protein